MLPLTGVLALVAGLDNGMGVTPVLAYSTWNFFNYAVNETLVVELADALISTGLSEVGFTTVNIDAGYLSHTRDPASHRLVVNGTKFPSGMRALADKLHARKIGLGVYTDIGNGSCGTGPGSFGHYQTDAETFADWQVDYLKVDFCGTHGPYNFSQWVDPAIQLENWKAMGDALNSTGRPIYYSICPHAHVPATGPSQPWYRDGKGYSYSPPAVWTAEERQGLANGILVEYTNLFDFWYADHWEDFRTCGPTSTCPECPYKPAKCSRFPNGTINPAIPLDPGGFITDVDAMVALTRPEYSGPGSWADGDMLQVCNYGGGGANAGGRHDGGMTLEEYRSSYSLWAILASPIIISADLRTLEADHPDCLAMLKNKELIAISQDPLGSAGALIRQATNASDPSPKAARNVNIVEQVFARRLEGGDMAVMLFNRAEHPSTMEVSWAEVGLCDRGPPCPAFRVRDIWAHNERGEERGSFESGYSAIVPPHAGVVIRVSKATQGKGGSQ